MRADRLIGGFVAAALLALPGIVTGPALAEDVLPDCNGPEMHLDEQGLHAPAKPGRKRQTPPTLASIR